MKINAKYDLKNRVGFLAADPANSDLYKHIADQYNGEYKVIDKHPSGEYYIVEVSEKVTPLIHIDEVKFFSEIVEG